MTASDSLLQRRARALAEPLPELVSPSEEGPQVLVLRAGDGRYAIDVTRVAEVYPLERLTLVPGAPPALLGVVTHRGRIVSVVHPGALYADVPGGPPAEGLVVGLSVPGASLGLFAEALADGEDVDTGMSSVLDADALACDPRVVVDHEPDQGSPT